MAKRKTAGLARLVTEQRNPRSVQIDRAQTVRILKIINREDARVPATVAREIPAIARAVDVVVEQLRRGGRLFYAGAGTSGRLGVLDASECAPTFNTPPTMVQGVMCGGVRALYRATEASEDSPALGRSDLVRKRLGTRDVVVGLTASGRTPYALGALRYARARRAATIAVTCNPDAEVAGLAQITIAPVVGPEVIAGSTRLKAGTAQKLVLNMISTAAMVRLGHVYGNFMVNVHLKNRKLRERGYTILRSVLGLDHGTAVRALRRAGGDLKAAILMHRKGLGRAAAQRLLHRHQGNLTVALESDTSGRLTRQTKKQG